MLPYIHIYYYNTNFYIKKKNKLLSMTSFAWRFSLWHKNAYDTQIQRTFSLVKEFLDSEQVFQRLCFRYKLFFITCYLYTLTNFFCNLHVKISPPTQHFFFTNWNGIWWLSLHTNNNRLIDKRLKLAIIKPSCM